MVNEHLLNEIDLDIWAYPTSNENGMNPHFDVMVSPNKYKTIQNVLQAHQINSTILHPNINDLILDELEMVGK